MGGYKIVLKNIDCNSDILSFEMPLPPYRDKLINLIKSCKEKSNGYCSVNIEKPYKPRTIGEGSQNNLFWKLCTIIAGEVGDDSKGMEDTENGIKLRAISKGYPFHISKITGEKIPDSMTTINTVQCSYLIDTAYQICAELGIQLEPELIRNESATKEQNVEELAKQAVDIF